MSKTQEIDARRRALRLPWTHVGDEGARGLAASSNLRGLRFLNLCDCGLHDEGAEAIASSPNFSRLSWLNLDDNAIGRQGAAAPYLKNVVAFRMRDNPLGNDDLKPLKHRFGSEALDSWWLGYLI